MDDEDEFADHRVRFGYPEAVITAALASCRQVEAAVAGGRAPYDGAATAWLVRVGEPRRH